MKLPYAAKARVERKKVVEYLLSFSHPDGSSKAEFFSRFGFRVDEWEVLARALRKHGREHVVTVSVGSAHGTRHSVDGPLLTPDDVIPKYERFGFWRKVHERHD
jgi:hypothetical protein